MVKLHHRHHPLSLICQLSNLYLLPSVEHFSPPLPLPSPPSPSLTHLSPQGIKFLQSHNIIGESADDVARYLLKGELLNKRAIGDYLGEA